MNQVDAVLIVLRRDAHARDFALNLPVDVDAGRAGILVVGAGHMVPAPRFEMLHRVASGNLAEARATARTVELQLFALEIRIADTQQQVLLDAHDGRDVDGQ